MKKKTVAGQHLLLPNVFKKFHRRAFFARAVFTRLDRKKIILLNFIKNLIRFLPYVP
ncbi:MAG: hypothetical protein MSA07_05870 [Mucispirillum sp.]|uniref:Uncharacterized protein n=1 Tax=Candidatus Mucispirillum faecigallinarum TaxID=2838699 RepID=A0A9D2GS72_9BACT|nr:hypothetical protein [Mucispirillum sp.]HIZ88412.1 hypothetical protein [Candidatus Mucispirillum faecigallinarum]